MSEARICDVCGKIIKSKYMYISVEEDNVNAMLPPLVTRRNYDMCPDCWKKIKVMFGKEQEHEMAKENDIQNKEKAIL